MQDLSRVNNSVNLFVRINGFCKDVYCVDLWTVRVEKATWNNTTNTRGPFEIVYARDFYAGDEGSYNQTFANKPGDKYRMVQSWGIVVGTGGGSTGPTGSDNIHVNLSSGQYSGS